MSPTFGNREWCICGHHDGDHDLEGDETQPCRAPGCICQVMRPTGEGMPMMVLLNAYGTGLEEDTESPELQDDAEFLEGAETSPEDVLLAREAPLPVIRPGDGKPRLPPRQPLMLTGEVENRVVDGEIVDEEIEEIRRDSSDIEEDDDGEEAGR